MATLIAIYNAAGVVGRCDERCYNARHRACNCICRSRNHGVGRARAEAHSPEIAAALTDLARRLGGKPFDRVELDPSVSQDTLFPIGDQA